MSSAEQIGALLDVQNVLREVGEVISILNVGQAELVTNDYGDIVSRETSAVLSLNSFPIEFSPSDKQITKAGLHGKFDVVAYVSKLDLDALSVTYEDLNEDHIELQIRGRQYKLTQSKEFSQFGSPGTPAFLYVVVGGKRF